MADSELSTLRVEKMLKKPIDHLSIVQRHFPIFDTLFNMMGSYPHVIELNH